MKSYDLIVIGAGPGGTDLAKDAASRGWKTALIEKDKIGGTCLNRGCIPTKALLHLSEVQASLESLATSGLCDEATVEKQRKALRSNATLDFRDRIVETQQQGLDQSIKKNKNIDFYEDFGQIIESGKVQLKESQEILEAEHIVLATGSVPQLIPIPGVDLAKVYTSDDFLDPSLPREIWDGLQNIVIIGGGVIGVEMADYLARSGREVTIIEALDRILPNMDVALSRGLAQSFKKRGIVVLSKAKVQNIEVTASSLTVHYVTAKEEEVEITCDAVLMATGRKAYTEGVVSPELAISMNGRTFAINERFECSIPNVYAIGDTRAGSMQLAHAASQDAKYLMEILEAKKAGVESGVGSAEESSVESRAVIPNCVYTSPELAQVGMTEAQAKEQGISIISGKANSLSNARNLIAGGERGFVNLVFASESLELLGAQWQGERATELIEELALAINQKLTIDDLLNQCFAHPSFVEILISALQAAKAKVKEI